MKRRLYKKGFTIVEVLVVVVVIGIIAGIVLVAYNGADSRANSAAAQVTVSQFVKSAEGYLGQNDRYPVSVTDCPTPAATNICLPLKSGQTLSYFVFGSGVPNRYSAAVHSAEPAFEMEFKDTKGFYYYSNAEITGGNEFVQYMDMAPIINKYGLQKYKLTFDIKSESIASNSNVNVYMQNGSGARYSFSQSVPVTTAFVRKSITVTPTGPNTSFVPSILAFYGTYGTGNRATIRNLTIEAG